jgi:acyl-CoA synthetase (AMP-forming)/AMP-acid ligase II
VTAAEVLHVVQGRVMTLCDVLGQVKQGAIGEVCIRGPNVTAGYLNRPEANAEAYAGGAAWGLTICGCPCPA